MQHSALILHHVTVSTRDFIIIIISSSSSSSMMTVSTRLSCCSFKAVLTVLSTCAPLDYMVINTSYRYTDSFIVKLTNNACLIISIKLRYVMYRIASCRLQ